MEQELTKRDLAQVLINFRAVGWAQGVFQNGTGACLGGSYDVSMRIHGMQQGHAGHDVLARALGFASAGDMYAWNDTPGRTQEEVEERIKMAIRGEIDGVEVFVDDTVDYDYVATVGGPDAMNIGQPVRTIIVEPARNPVPERAPAPAPQRRPMPRRDPITPEPVPEKVPAR